MFVIRPGEVLLIRKLRGLGAGKINAPGGRLEPGETLVEAAMRETREEVGVTPRAPRLRGELRFEFVDGYRLECHVFSADDCDGEARPSDEAIPIWTPLWQIPYREMWADDALWVPLMLSGRTPFSGRFVFAGDALLDHALTANDPAQALFARLDALGIAHETRAHAPVFTVEQARREWPSGGDDAGLRQAGEASTEGLRQDGEASTEGLRQAGEASTEGLRQDGEAWTEGLHTKNLFVRNKKGRMWLVTLAAERPVDLKQLARTLDAGNLTFASPARLRQHLGVEPGSVTALAALNDPAGLVTVVLDAALAASPAVWCHPLTNDRTTRLSGSDLVRFLGATGHPPVMHAL